MNDETAQSRYLQFEFVRLKLHRSLVSKYLELAHISIGADLAVTQNFHRVTSFFKM